MGIGEVLPKIPRILKVLSDLVAEVERRKPAVAILVDVPDFNLRLAKRLKKVRVGCNSLSSASRPAACASPEASPATTRTERSDTARSYYRLPRRRSLVIAKSATTSVVGAPHVPPLRATLMNKVAGLHPPCVHRCVHLGALAGVFVR